MCSLICYPYNPDTISDLRKDEDALEYWLNCFQELIKKFAKQAEQSQKSDVTSFKRSENFKQDYLDKLNKLKENKTHDEPITIRYLLDLNEKLLRLHGFIDPWTEQKRMENEAAVICLKSRLYEIDEIDSIELKWLELIKGLLAGNIFDWGAQVVSDILENDKKFGLKEALSKIQKRPWLIDNVDDWLNRLKGPPHKCAVIFVDNSGVDIILGILPFARELLKRRTKVLLCANTEPSLNDITCYELKEILVKCCNECDIIKDAFLLNNQLLVYGNGQSTPCLDMSNISSELNNAIESNETDLLIIEGMGRSVHTNLNAKFTCDTLKLAVIKNQWLANKLGGDIFSVICKYEKI